MNRIILLILIAIIFIVVGCTSDDFSKKIESNLDTAITTNIDKVQAESIDTIKRNKLVEKYNLLEFPKMKQPVLLSIDEFFDGNNDEGSIAPNLDNKLPVSEYYKTLKRISEDDRVVDAFLEIKDVNMDKNKKLSNDQWFYSDAVYFIGDLTTEEVIEATKSLKPDEVGYVNEKALSYFNKKYKGQRGIYIWWD